ncbi:MAG: restriction endonuclease [Thermoplasmatales archaeon]
MIMALWMVRAGRQGIWEHVFFENNIVGVSWGILRDLSRVKSKEELTELYRKTYPADSEGKVTNVVGQLWRFVRMIKEGDLVAVPLKSQSAVAIGQIVGGYIYRQLPEGAMHVRPVKWLRTIPRSEFPQDILYSLGAWMTVCRVERNNAEARVRKLLEGEKTAIQPVETADQFVEEALEQPDIEQMARDQIVKYIEARFKGHGLARLVDAVLQAEGYDTTVSPPGPDGGIDILAAAPLGQNRPPICVQVKSTSSPVDVKVLRELQGVMSNVGAKQGLLVSWGGFTSKALQEARDVFFNIRLWDQGKLIEEILKYYERFDDELKAELPLKRIWTLVVEEQ